MPDANKTEQATPRRRQKARAQGQVPRSREFPNMLAMTGAVIALTILGPAIPRDWSGFYRALLDQADRGGLSATGPVLFWCTLATLRWIVPLLSAAVVLSVLAGLLQGGFNVAPEALRLRPERLNPSARLGQIFSPLGFSQLLKSLLPFSAIAWAGYATLAARWNAVEHASLLDTRDFAAMLGAMALSFAWKAAMILLAWSGVDYLITWRKMESDLRMSREELREETKQTDGNPVIKQRIRRLRRRTRKTFSRQAVATATVVVTNPTHYAVALRYEPSMPAPVVVAKGMNLLAQEIRAIAIEHGIALMENRPLAQALYKSVEVDDAIPSVLYHAVADILAVVFRAQTEVRRQEALRRGRNASGHAARNGGA